MWTELAEQGEEGGREVALARLGVARPGWLRVGLVAVAGLGVLGAIALAGTGWTYRPFHPSVLARSPGASPGSPTERDLASLGRDNRRLEAELRRRAPQGNYVVVDQSHNRLYLKRGDEVLLDAVCSTGSGMVLRESAQGKTWIFDTPRGMFTVRQRVEDPVWRKPDWAFVEEGKPIPADPGERIEYGVLGEYALYLGDGYMIHGTLYERLLGRSVTHGCIRVGRDDLRVLYRSAPIGTPVFIF
jgi:L,D-transpeptidase YbiS